MLKYFQEHSGTSTAIRYKVSRKTLYKWLKRFDGTIGSLIDRSHKPHSSPRAHSEAEIKLVKRVVKHFHWIDLLQSYQVLQAKGYNRSYGGFKRLVGRLKALKPKKPKQKRKPKPYRRAECPGEKVQLDVKFVPSECSADGKKYYQYTAVDECTRWTYREMYDEHSTYSSKDFLTKLLKHAPFPIGKVQTDNGSEWTNALLVVKAKHKTLFEQALNELGIEYQRIRIATPRHNGKVERMHRTDQMRIYDHLRFFGLDDGRKQLAEYTRRSNYIIKTVLGMRSPNQVLRDYLAVV